MVYLISAIVNLRDGAPPRTHCPESNAWVTRDAINSRNTLKVLAAYYGIGIGQFSAPICATHPSCAPPLTPIPDKPTHRHPLG